MQVSGTTQITVDIPLSHLLRDIKKALLEEHHLDDDYFMRDGRVIERVTHSAGSHSYDEDIDHGVPSEKVQALFALLAAIKTYQTTT